MPVSTKPIRRTTLALTTLAALGLAAIAHAAPFTAGDLVVTRIGDGSAALTSAATAEFLDEYTAAGMLVQSIALPTAATGSNQPFADTGTGTSDGALTLSANGQYLTVGGYAAAPGTLNITGTASATTPRVIARIGADGTVDTSTALTDAYTANNFRGVVSTDGTAFYTAGTATTATGGVRYAASDGATTSTQVESAILNTRIVNIVNGNLYASAGAAGFNGIYQIGTGLPTTTGQATTLIVGTGTGSSPYDFVFTSATTVYVTDDRATSAGGLLQYTNTGSGFTLANTYNLAGLTNGTFAGLRGLTSNGTDLFGISTDNRLVDFNLASTSFSTVATGLTNTALRGVDFAPAPEPGQVSILLLCGLVLGLTLARRRLRSADAPLAQEAGG